MNKITSIDNIKDLPPEFHLIFYGSCNFMQLAAHLNVSYLLIRNNSLASIINNWRLEFISRSPFYGGTMATIVPYKGGIVKCIAIKIVHEEQKFFIGDVEVNLKNLCKHKNMDKGEYVLWKMDDAHYIPSPFRNEYKLLDESWSYIGISKKEERGMQLYRPINFYLQEISDLLLDRYSILNGRNNRITPKIEIILR